MGRNGKTVIAITTIIFCFVLIADSLPIGEDIFSQKASAVPREFEENITVQSNQIVPLDLLFTQGDELELIFEMEVKEDLPVDIWFVDYANYVRLVDGNEFLYFIDGSGQELKMAAKVVTVTQYGTYELVFANYNNVTVEVNLKYDINVYPEEEETTPDGSDKEEETPLWQEFYVMLPLGLVVGIIVGLLASRMTQRSAKGKPGAAPKKKGKAKKKAPAKKTKSKKVKKKKPVAAKKAAEEEAEPEEELETEEEAPTKEVEEPPTATKPSHKFCGHCGKPVETPFCPICGKEVSKG